MRFEEIEVKAALPAAARTASANGASQDLQLWSNVGGRAMKAVLDIGAASGTGPTLDVKLQESADGSTFSDIAGAAFAQKNAASTSELHFRTTKRYVRAVATIAGTSPSFTFGVYVLGDKRSA